MIHASLPEKITCAALCAVSLALGGCLLRPSYSAMVTSADGVEMEVPLGQLPAPAEDGPVKLGNLQFTPWKMEKGMGLAFMINLVFKDGAQPASVLLEDDTDLPILTLMASTESKMLPGGRWLAVSPAYFPSDEHVNWVMTLDNGVRIYRITVKLKDGTTHVLRAAIFVPAQNKAFMRSQLGVS